MAKFVILWSLVPANNTGKKGTSMYFGPAAATRCLVGVLGEREPPSGTKRSTQKYTIKDSKRAANQTPFEFSCCLPIWSRSAHLVRLSRQTSVV